jgi:hypothetical protein
VYNINLILQCGTGVPTIYIPIILPSSLFNNEKVKLISCGGIAYTFIVTEAPDGNSDNLYFTGTSTFGVIGDDRYSTSHVCATPTLVQAQVLVGKRIEYITSGSYHSVLKTTDGEFYGAGYQGNGELAGARNNYQWTRLEIPNLARVVTGYYHTVFVDVFNKIFICGRYCVSIPMNLKLTTFQ